MADLTAGKELIASGMRQEVERCRAAIQAAQAGKTVSLVSSGDAGIYGMAGLAMELAKAMGADVKIEVVPGVTAASAAAAVLGAPLMLDFAVISLSDLLVEWETIRARLEAMAAADLVLAIYNPRSTKRTEPFRQAMEILRRHRPGRTLVGLARAVGSCEQQVKLTTLARLDESQLDMRTVMIVGSSQTRRVGGRMVTTRGYRI